jgi:hypothetical protein
MSTPIRQVEVSPEDPKFYAPPRWRRGEVVAPSIQPSLRSTEFPVPQAYPDWTSHHGDEVLEDALADERGRSMYRPVAGALPKVRKHSARRGSGNMRVTALAIAAGVVLWTAVCVVLALGRLDVINFEQLRNGLPSAKGAETSAVAPPHTITVALAETPKEVVTPTPAKEVVTPTPTEVAAPTLAVADAIGESNATLPLAIRVTNAAPGTTITLSGLAAGTKLSSGVVAGEGQWRIALDDQSSAADGLQSTFVTPPSDFVGPMTIIAELRSRTDQAIARAPARLTWRPSAIDLSESVKPTPSALSVPADDSAAPKEALLAWQDEPTTNGVSSQPKVRKHISSASKPHAARNQHVAKKRQNRATSQAQDPQATVTPWREVRSPFAYDISADRRAGRRSSWGDDVQNIVDRSWQRCTFNCDRDNLR